MEKIRSLGLTPHAITGTERKVVAVIGHTGGIDPDDLFGTMPGVAEALRVSQPFKLVSREVKEEDTVIDVGGVPSAGRPSSSWRARAPSSRRSRSSRRPTP